MKRSPISLSDPAVIRAWQRRGVEAAQAKRRKLDAERLRKQERNAARANRTVQVFPESVTPVVVRSRDLTRVERRRRAADLVGHPAMAPVVGQRTKFNAQTIVCRESDEGVVVEAFFRSPDKWHPPMIVAPNRGHSWVRVRNEMLEAAGYRCQAASPGCRVSANHVHHVLPRGRGGKDNGSTPLLVVCFVCHQWIHEHPYAARERGWLV